MVKTRLTGGCLKALLFFCALGFADPSYEPDLSTSLKSYADSVAPGVRLGLSVRSVRTNTLLHQVDGSGWFVPASTLKTVLTAAAVYYLPLDYAPELTLSLEGVRKGRTFVGVVRVTGKGEPNVSGRYFPDALYPLRGLADSLRALGIDTLQGRLLADTSFYSGPRRPVGWRPNYFSSWYGAEVSPLGFNDNCVLVEMTPGNKPGDSVKVNLLPDVGYVRVANNMKTVAGKGKQWVYSLDSLQPVLQLGGTLGALSGKTTVVLPVTGPAGYLLSALKLAFSQRGVAFVADTAAMQGKALHTLRLSLTPLRSWLDEINQRSQNLHAEMLLRNLGQYRWKQGTAEAGIRAELLFLHEAKLPAADFHLVDGSGLSPDNKLKPDALTRMLAYMARHPRRDFYLSTFGLPGVTGNQGRRLSGLEASHRVRFKTGFINGVHGLAGYAATQQGDTLAMAIYLNGADKLSDAQGRALVDTLWNRVVRLYNREYADVLEAQQLWLQGESLQEFNSRLRWFSAQLRGRPYRLGPLGEGMTASLEKGPLFDMREFDCVTYLEHVLALSRAASPEYIFAELQSIRYAKGQVGYTSRNHYFVADWIANNADKVALLRMPGDTVELRTMDKRRFFADKGLLYQGPQAPTEVPYLPLDKALDYAGQTWNGPDSVMGVGFVGKSPQICVTHTGFLLLRQGEKPLLRHASQLLGKVVDQPLEEYLRGRVGKTPGVLFFSWLAPRR